MKTRAHYEKLFAPYPDVVTLGGMFAWRKTAFSVTTAMCGQTAAAS